MIYVRTKMYIQYISSSTSSHDFLVLDNNIDPEKETMSSLFAAQVGCCGQGYETCGPLVPALSAGTYSTDNCPPSGRGHVYSTTALLSGTVGTVPVVQ
jgi:Na+-translocating ferredoxin:NAD+ oxidoreductase RNF subunit RnfB